MNYGRNHMNNNPVTYHVFEKNRYLCNEALSEEALDTAPIDWENLEELAPSVSDETISITYEQALEYFKGADLSEYNGKIVAKVQKSGNIFACFSNLRKCSLKQEHSEDCNLLYLIAKFNFRTQNIIDSPILNFGNTGESMPVVCIRNLSAIPLYSAHLHRIPKGCSAHPSGCSKSMFMTNGPYRKDNKKHLSMLRTVYDSLVLNKTLDFSWENIGFQSNLPWDDLRGVGMFGVLQLLYLSTLCPVLRNMLYELSVNKCNTFPFAAVSLNMTSVVLNVLRRERLNRDINKEGVFACTGKLYAAIFYHFGRTWTNEKKTISDIGELLKDIERLCLSKVSRRKMVKNLECEFLSTDND